MMPSVVASPDFSAEPPASSEKCVRFDPGPFSEALASAPEGEQRVIVATDSYIGEGFDGARLDTLFLAMPISWRGTRQLCRLHRLHDGKRVVEVYDYVDPHMGMLARM